MKPKKSKSDQARSSQAPPFASIRLDPRTWLAAAALFGATMILYWPSVHNDFIYFDDPSYAAANTNVQNGLTWGGLAWSFTTPVVSNWHPLTMISLMLDCQLFGKEPWGHHFISILLHSVNAALVFVVFRKITGTFWRSWMVGALFGWHPLHVESVAWVSERKDVLSTFFWFLAMWTYACFAVEKQLDRSRKSKIFYVLTLMLTMFGLMSKAMLVTIPCVLLLVDFWPLARFKTLSVRELVIEKIPFIALVVVMSLVTYQVQQQSGAVGTTANYPLTIRIENAVISYCRYLLKTIWPNDLAFYYPYPITGYWQPEWVMTAAGIIGTITIIFIFTRRSHPYMLAGWLWFLGTLVPVIGLVQIGGQAMADRYTYVPLIGIFLVMCWGIRDLARNKRFAKGVLSIGIASVIIVCFTLTRIQIEYWKDTETLFSRTLAVTQNNYLIQLALGNWLADHNRLEDAIPYFTEFIRLDPKDAGGYVGLGLVYLRQNRPTEAIDQFQEAIRQQPNSLEAHFNLGDAFMKESLADPAIEQFQETLRLNPNDPDATVMLAQARALKARSDSMISKLADLNNQAWNLATDPDPSKRNGARAVELAESACNQTHYSVPILIGTLAAAYAEAGRFDEAVATGQKACSLATQLGDTNLANRNQTLIKLYQTHQAYHGK